MSYSDKIDTEFGDDIFGVNSCGASVASTSSGGTSVTIRFSIPTDTARGDYPAASDAGVKAVQSSDYNAANCPSIS